MAEIVFEEREDSLALLNPLKGFAHEVQYVRVRRDPLLGHAAVYNPQIEAGSKMFIGAVDRELVERLRAESASWCFFCPDKLAGVARFPDEFIPGGTVREGETVLFPNLFALAQHHAVAAVSAAHFLEPGEFSPALLADAFRAIQRYVVAVFERDAAAAHVSVNANYLFPAGASLMHPHFQVLVTPEPYTHQARLLDACRDHFRQHGGAYHADLIRMERRLGSRYIAQTGDWHWMAAYAPLGSNEILGVHEGEGDFTRLGDAGLIGLAEGLARVLHTYGRLGYLSFNFTLYAKREPKAEDGFNCLMRCITRQNPYPNHRTDDFYLQRGLQTELILQLPESLAAEARKQASASRE